MKVLMLYTSNEGQTAKIMLFIKAIIDKQFECDCIQLTSTTEIDLSQYQAVIIGTSIRYGYYSKLIKQFIDANTAQLNQIYGAFFGVNLVARKPNKDNPETNLYTRKFLAKLTWQPKLKAVFAGALFYPRYNWFDRNMIRMIMWLGKGETDISIPMIEYTNWNKVQEFAETFIKNNLDLSSS
ncbi:menaquinone-dependent protoporphyrinogen IX dehydrogenase [Utexia brackfieldae]|uniref:menaquinone-dependent protoporphyrinogen IX dehydrogenase n=1 Tax=Utexia brackfieldae TaxID=3074108 RepID=UPI00370D62C9